MTQGQWNTVLETNALLHASYVRLLRKGTVCKVERAMYPAFQLRSRLFLDFNASKDDKDIVIPARHLFIPRFRVEDDSYVEVSENKSSVASAIATSSLSETAAEVAVAGAQAGFKAEEQGSESKATSEETRHMTITYNFPRVVLQLDEESLELTEECANDLAHVTDMASITAFKARYGIYYDILSLNVMSNERYLGTFFATRVELGGRLHATEDSAALGKTSVSEKSKAMKAAASLSFSSPWVQASASASSVSSSANKTESSESSLNVSMTWEAKGGDTLLCNKRATWLKENAKEWRRVLLQSEKNVFKLHGKIATTDSKTRALAGGAYTLCDMDDTYLEGTPFGPSYPFSYMHEGAKETAWVFTMNPQNSLQETHSDLEPKAGFQFRKKPPRAVHRQ
ncbi:hypothetical protein APSETT444_006098 [Aspergillus pseudonomiae]